MNSPAKQRDRIVRPVSLGLFLGGLLGFAMRPSVLLIGQLPFAVVITRGTTLTGADRLFADVAARSFNMVFAGAVVGGLIAWVLAALMTEREPGR